MNKIQPKTALGSVIFITSIGLFAILSVFGAFYVWQKYSFGNNTNANNK